MVMHVATLRHCAHNLPVMTVVTFKLDPTNFCSLSNTATRMMTMMMGMIRYFFSSLLLPMTDSFVTVTFIGTVTLLND
jgi:hypothetical protein